MGMPATLRPPTLLPHAVAVRSTHGLVAGAIVITIAALLVGLAEAVVAALAAPGIARGPLSAIRRAIPVARWIGHIDRIAPQVWPPVAVYLDLKLWEAKSITKKRGNSRSLTYD